MTIRRISRLLLLLPLAMVSGLLWADNERDIPLHNPFKRPNTLPQLTKMESRTAERRDTAPSFKLRAVMLAGKQTMVLVNDKLLGIGEIFQGYKLLSAGEGYAVFQGEDAEYRVSLERDETRQNDVF